ncbi:MAG: carboxylating nicotinate-nucleotide diphosphorylase [Actinobacteria bacterium]|nr:carboxylating nicotinate-nucleotide diphosphorylase [Actinomycetota bacterium]
MRVRRPPEALLALARTALGEDLGRGDVTSRITILQGTQARARFIAREDLVVSGLEAARAVFFEVDCEEMVFETLAREGDRMPADSILAAVEGPARSILAAERVALNLVMRLSGIATLTSRYVEAIADTRAVITDTRKTTPGLRLLEKAAVRGGGGTNHRAGLDDGVLIKDNHLALTGSVTEAVRRAQENSPHLLKVEVEVESLGALEEALRAGADAVLLDNMTPEEVREAARLAHKQRPNIVVEVSGGVNLRTVRSYAEAGPDLISVGALTHSAPAADISLEVDPC